MARKSTTRAPKKPSRKGTYRFVMRDGAPVPLARDATTPMQSWTIYASASISTSEVQAVLEQGLGSEVRVEPALHTTVQFGDYDAAALADLRQKTVAREFETRRRLLASSQPVEKICDLLGVRSRQTIHNWIESGKVLALEDGNRKLLPLWQFDASMRDRLVPGFKKTLDILKRTPFSAAMWFTNPNPRLGNRAPIDVLRTGDTKRVEKEAMRAEQTP